MKDRFRTALILILLSFLFTATLSNCQETSSPSSASNDVGLPNAPSTTQAATRTEKNGKPCPEGVHKSVRQYPSLPEARIERIPTTVHFWTIRGWQEPPLRTNKQVFRSKVFLAEHVGGAIAMIVACRTRNSGEDWESGVPAIAGMLGMDYITYRFVNGPTAIGPAVYEMVHYGLTSAR